MDFSRANIDQKSPLSATPASKQECINQQTANIGEQGVFINWSGAYTVIPGCLATDECVLGKKKKGIVLREWWGNVKFAKWGCQTELT